MNNNTLISRFTEFLSLAGVTDDTIHVMFQNGTVVRFPASLVSQQTTALQKTHHAPIDFNQIMADEINELYQNILYAVDIDAIMICQEYIADTTNELGLFATHELWKDPFLQMQDIAPMNESASDMIAFMNNESFAEELDVDPYSCKIMSLLSDDDLLDVSRRSRLGFVLDYCFPSIDAIWRGSVRCSATEDGMSRLSL